MSRRADGYQPEWDINLAEGQASEKYIQDMFDGRTTVEVKSDHQAARTGNVYIEYQCRRRDGWNPSGLSTTTADVWAFHLPPSGLVLFIPTDDLKRVAREHWSNRRDQPAGSHPTKGVVIPVSRLVTDTFRFKTRKAS